MVWLAVAESAATVPRRRRWAAEQRLSVVVRLKLDLMSLTESAMSSTPIWERM